MASIQTGGFLTVYYDAGGSEADSDNLHIYQIEKLLQMLYSVQKKQSVEEALGFVRLLSE